MQVYHGLEDSQVARWERYVVARRNLSGAWGDLAAYWLESFTCGDESAATAVFRDAGSLNAHMQIARGLVGKASSEQLSAFLVKLANYHGMDGTSPLGTDGVLAAEELMNGPWHPLDASHPEAGTKMILAVLGSVRRSATVPGADWRLANTFSLAVTYLKELLAGGHADPAMVADALLDAEIAASASLFPWIALVFERLDREAKPVARAMRDRVDQRDFHPDIDVTDSHTYRIQAEIRLSSEGVQGLLAVLEEWPDAPYGEFLCRLPESWVPMPRLQLLESAQRMDRLRWTPGWPQHVPRKFTRWPVRYIHESLPGHPMWGDVAIGDVVMAIAGLGRTDEARQLLHDHALRESGSSHRSEFWRVWTTAELGDGMEEAAAEIFGPAVPDLDCLLTELSRVPELYFSFELPVVRSALGTILLTAVLLEDIPPEGHARNLEAPTWATSFFSHHPAATDDLRALAALPPDEVADDLEGGVLDRELARRIQPIAGQIIGSNCTARSLGGMIRTCGWLSARWRARDAPSRG